MSKPNRPADAGDEGGVSESERAPEMGTDHTEISELLPDYAAGSLPDGDLWRVEWHLSGCAQCQAEFAGLLDLVSRLVVTLPPRPVTKQRLLAAARPLPAAPVLRDAASAPRESSSRRWPWFRLGRAPQAILGALALAAFLLGGWNLVLQRELAERSWVEGLLTNPAAAHPLTDSELASGASGVFFADGDLRQAVLLANDLPTLGDDRRYQVWLFTEEGERISGGLFDPNDDGTATAIIDAPAPMGDYWAVGISAEPADGSLAPTSPLVLGGWIQ